METIRLQLLWIDAQVLVTARKVWVSHPPAASPLSLANPATANPNSSCQLHRTFSIGFQPRW
jgi:hypothetical protein